MTFFTSDHHFWHTNIIGYCDRPFTKADGQPDVVAMNEEMVRRWNEVVAPEDEVWHLGDFSFGGFLAVEGLTKRLNGTKHLVKGNHDRHSNRFYLQAGFASVQKRATLTIDGKRILLIHRPPLLAALKGWSMALCGHVHGAWSSKVTDSKPVINVGVDVRGFRPVTLAELLATQT